jgi:cation diffusion facilitator family transporter
MNLSPQQRQREIIKVLLITLVLNALIAGAKLIYGYHAGAMSMIADGFHSLMDGSSNVIGLVAIGYAFAPPDAEHPYGHRKAEVLAALGISVLLGMTCLEIGRELWERIWHPSTPNLSFWAFVIMVTGVLVNLAVVAYESRAGKRLGSQMLSSDAEHTRSDVLVSLSVIASLVGISLKWYWLDLVVSAAIIIVIGKIAWELFSQNFQILVDRMPIDSQAISARVEQIPGISHCHKVRAHGTADAIYMEFHIWVDPQMSVADAHALSHQAKDALQSEITGLSDVTIHIEPSRALP